MTLMLSFKAVNFVLDQHEGQLDKQGEAYSKHLLGVAELAPERLFLPALAHDVLEDTSATEHDLRQHDFTDEQIELVKLLTLKKGKRRDDYLRAIRGNPDAACIKVADVVHNVSRIHGIEDEDERKRLTQKYVRTLEILVNGY